MSEVKTKPDSYTGAPAHLLTYGQPEGVAGCGSWPNYLALGLTRDDVAQLVRMATDPALNNAEKTNRKVWAPVHAWRALAQLGATEAAEPLIELAASLPDDDWVSEELPDVFARLGPDILPALSTFIADETVDSMARITAVTAIERMGQAQEEATENCKDVLREHLTQHQRQAPDLNAFLILGLVNLGASEDIELIRQPFAEDNVDLMLIGDIEDVEVELRIRDKRSARRPKLGGFVPLRTSGLQALAHGWDGHAPATKRRKIGRNELCPCGSGNKYKRCCGRN